ncbi:hypothetical protein SFA35_13635 [Pseudomonas sp. HR96]|uniref:hypothetical protein n=1 Tax=Pseudomonas sp. HR96 TaxID=1027966 RepID=UPI002A75E5D6|nr:hypothetical protein [Pseudomonas sp. HR96]WPO97704.1 hypothetical protein SFA35_13635 [Pseudomonas sp. HR96]
MKDQLRAEPDRDLDLDHLDLHDDRGLRPGLRHKPRSANWLAWQIALGIVVGGSALWVLGALVSLVTAKLMLGDLQISVPGLTH